MGWRSTVKEMAMTGPTAEETSNATMTGIAEEEEDGGLLVTQAERARYEAIWP